MKSIVKHVDGRTILEHIDGITLVGAVEWRCHECAAHVAREMLHWHDDRLLCDECNQRAKPSN